jgi:hypothetical protein
MVYFYFFVLLKFKKNLIEGEFLQIYETNENLNEKKENLNENEKKIEINEIKNLLIFF